MLSEYKSSTPFLVRKTKTQFILYKNHQEYRYGLVYKPLLFSL